MSLLATGGYVDGETIPGTSRQNLWPVVQSLHVYSERDRKCFVRAKLFTWKWFGYGLERTKREAGCIYSVHNMRCFQGVVVLPTRCYWERYSGTMIWIYLLFS